MARFYVAPLPTPPEEAEDSATFGASVATDGLRVVVGAPLHDVSRGLLRDPTDGGCVYVFEGELLDWRMVQRLTVPDAGIEHAALGEAVAIAGKTLVAGGPQAIRDDHPQAGIAVIYEHRPGDAPGYQPTALLAAPGRAHTGMRFGAAVAASQRIVLVGLPHSLSHAADQPVHELREDGGSVLAWERAPATRPGVPPRVPRLADPESDWSPGPRLGPHPMSDGFGEHMAFFGDHLLTGLDGGDAARTLGWIWRMEATTWEREAILATPPPLVPRVAQGPRPVALSRDLAVVGLPEVRVGDSPEVGAAAIFERTEAGWRPAGFVEFPRQPEAGTRFGAAVAIAGDRVVVGAPGQRLGQRQAGGVHVYRREHGAWVHEHGWQPQVVGTPDEARGLQAGAALAAADDLVVIGAPGADMLAEPDRRDIGAAWVMTIVDGQ